MGGGNQNAYQAYDDRPIGGGNANAYQAYYEMMPLRTSSLPVGPQMSLYRKGNFGTLAEFFVLDNHARNFQSTLNLSPTIDAKIRLR